MRTEDEILKLARRLPPARRRRIADKLLESAEREAGSAAGAQDRRLAALKRFLELAGTGHSAVTDVSTDKYKHLAEIYADKR